MFAKIFSKLFSNKMIAIVQIIGGAATIIEGANYLINGEVVETEEQQEKTEAEGSV